MAISVAGTATGTASGGAAATINLPGTPAENDLIVVFVGSPGGGLSLTSTGYTTVKDATNSNGTTLFAKRMSSSPDSQVIVADNSNVRAVIVYNLRGVDTTTFEDAAAQAGVTADPPSITTVTANAWVGAFVSGTGGTMGSITAPSGYSDKLDVAGGSSVQVMGAWKSVASPGAENPGTFTETSSFEDSVTWAVRPAAVAAGGNSKNMLLMGVG